MEYQIKREGEKKNGDNRATTTFWKRSSNNSVNIDVYIFSILYDYVLQGY